MTSSGMPEVNLTTDPSPELGVAHTWALVQEGARVVSFDVNDGEGPFLVDELGEDSVLFLRGDATSAADWEQGICKVVGDRSPP